MSLPKGVNKIETVTAILMILVALTIDGLQVVLDFIIIGVVFNPIITAASYLIFFLWFSLGCGIKFRGKKLTGVATTLIIELIPFLSSLPGITFGVVITILTNWAETTAQKGGIAEKAVSKMAEKNKKNRDLKAKKDETDLGKSKETGGSEKQSPNLNQGEKRELPPSFQRNFPEQGAERSSKSPVGLEIRNREPLRNFPTKPVGQKPPSRT